MVEALLLGLVAFIAQSEYALGTSLISRPIVTGLLTGLVLGDVQTGVIMGATLDLWRRHRNGVVAWPAYRHADFDPEKHLSGDVHSNA